MSILTPIGCALLLAAGASAPLSFDIKHLSGVPSERLLATQRLFAGTRHLTWRAAASPEERAVTQAVLQIYGGRFRPRIVADPVIATLTENGVDVLAARLRVRGEDLEGDVIVWNTPNDTTLIFHLPRRSWSSDEAVRSAFERLLLPPNTAGGAVPGKGVQLSLAKDARTGMHFGAGGLMERYFPRQFSHWRFLSWIDCWETAEASYLAFGFDQLVTPEVPRELRLLPERFPPLSVRVNAWSKQRLLSELSHRDELRRRDPLLNTRVYRTAKTAIAPAQSQVPPTSWSERDTVLAAELIRRGVTDDELLNLWQARRRFENGAMLQAIVKADEAPRYAEAIRAYLRQGGFSEGKGTNPFRTVHATVSVDFTDAALEVLRATPDANSAFEYAAAHGKTPAVYRELVQTPRVGIAQYGGRDYELKGMRARLKLNADGSPQAEQ